MFCRVNAGFLFFQPLTDMASPQPRITTQVLTAVAGDYFFKNKSISTNKQYNIKRNTLDAFFLDKVFITQTILLPSQHLFIFTIFYFLSSLLSFGHYTSHTMTYLELSYLNNRIPFTKTITYVYCYIEFIFVVSIIHHHCGVEMD